MMSSPGLRNRALPLNLNYETEALSLFGVNANSVSNDVSAIDTLVSMRTRFIVLHFIHLLSRVDPSGQGRPRVADKMGATQDLIL